MSKINWFRGLAIEGGGVAGITYIGCLKSWVDNGFSIDQWTHFAGSSAGALMATLLAARAPLHYMERRLKETDFAEFKDDSWGVIADIYRLIEKYGWYKGKALKNWVKSALADLTNNPDITFKQLHEMFGTHLILTKTDVLYPRCKLVAMDYLSHPDEPVANAVRASCGIPLFFEAQFGTGRDDGHVYVDGGVLLNYPIELLYKYLDPSQVMGMYLLSKGDDITGASQNTVEYRPIKNHQEFLVSMAKTWREQAMTRHIKSTDWDRTCKIDVPLKATDFEVSVELQNECIDLGYQSMSEWILRN